MLRISKRKRNKIIIFSFLFLLFVFGVVFLLFLLRGNMIFFYTPSQLAMIKPVSKVRVGGFVESDSLSYESQSQISFFLTDNQHSIKVLYHGEIPMLFKEGQNVILEGRFSEELSHFIAFRLMVKHDEVYLPKKAKAFD